MRSYSDAASTITGKRDHRGRLLAAIDGKAPPDYIGILRGGRALVVEAKRRTGRLRRDDARDGIPAHQTAWLDDAHRSVLTHAAPLLRALSVPARRGYDHFVP